MLQTHTPRTETPRLVTPRVGPVMLTPREVVSPQGKPDHELPALDIPWKSEATNSKNSRLEHNSAAAVAELSSLLPMLVNNFARIHTNNALILSKLQIYEEIHYTSPNSSPHGAFAPPLLKKPSYDQGGLSEPIYLSSKDSEPRVNYTSTGSNSKVKTSANDPEWVATSTKVSKFTLVSSREDMDKIARIIQSHTKRVLRKGGAVQEVWQFLENRTSSRSAYFYGSYFAPFFLIISVLTSFLQTVDEWAMPETIFDAIQMTFEFWFACEIALRFAVCPDRVQFWFNTFNMIDLVSVAPLFMRICVWIGDFEERGLVEVIALVPMLRLLKILRRFHKFQLLISAFSIALEALPVLIFSLMLIAIMFSGIIYLLEPRTLISDLPRALWFVMVTMSTVGYGDIVPETRPGQALSAFLMVLSALYMALPIGIVGNAFSEVWKDRDRLLLLAVLRESFAISGVSRSLIQEIFLHFTSESVNEPSEDPEMDVAEFKKMMLALQIDVSEERIVALFMALDADGSGKISCDEFIHKLFPIQFINRRAPRTGLMEPCKSWAE